MTKISKQTFTVLLFCIAISVRAFAQTPDLIYEIGRQSDKTSYIFKLKGSRTFKIFFAETTHDGEKLFNQRVYMQTSARKDSIVSVGLYENPILDLDSSKKTITIRTLNDNDTYQLTVKGRIGLYDSQVLPEVTTGYSLDTASPATHCDFGFASTSDPSLKCTIRIEIVEE